ncbi:MAG: hypothetical protein A2511_16725 [Deltaproteobacteria bacterium RIFOXYD12_FULL_50_9]|nr:MAG: hypothetical protein A2511_16725 [Deltaproteobacteria bacterium RIFOXYD12_FULL_50_9]
MNFDYFLSSPQGDRKADTALLASPFLISLTEHHSILTLGDYFSALKKFALNRPKLTGAESIRIRSEKHGALYHIASLTATLPEQTLKLTVSSALSENGKICLARDFNHIDQLNKSLNLPFLPAVYAIEPIAPETFPGNLSFLMVLAEWFDDHHEWHLTKNGQEIMLWDHVRGNRLLDQTATFAVFRQIAAILTQYYDVPSARQIHPWHHAAGDFIVNEEDGDIRVRLTTARDYCRLSLPFRDSGDSPLIALLFFFLHLTIRTRLDRVEGVDAPVWAAEFAVPATVTGFFEALIAMTGRNQIPPGMVDSLLTMLRSCTPAELAAMSKPLLNFYNEESPHEVAFIADHLEEHSTNLHAALKMINPNA